MDRQLAYEHIKINLLGQGVRKYLCDNHLWVIYLKLHKKSLYNYKLTPKITQTKLKDNVLWNILTKEDPPPQSRDLYGILGSHILRRYSNQIGKMLEEWCEILLITSKKAQNNDKRGFSMNIYYKKGIWTTISWSD